MTKHGLTIEERFWLHVDNTGSPDTCWPWTAGCCNGGYGCFHAEGGKKRRASVMALEWKLGRPLLPGMCALHTCDNPPCCNAAHLFEGTKGDNVKDAVSKGRHPHGERQGMAKLTDERVIAIRARYKTGSCIDGLAAIAKDEGVSTSLICMVVKRQLWKHI